MTRSYDKARGKALIAKSLRMAPHPAGDVPFVEKFAIGDKVVLRNGKTTTITAISKYGDYVVEGVSGAIPGKMLKRAPP